MHTHGIIAQISRIRERANMFIKQELKKRSIEGILPAHGAVLYFLFKQHAPVPIKEIVLDTRRVKSTITDVLKTLERYGYISRIPSDDDNRVILIELTEKGRSIRKDFDDISEKLLHATYENMTPDESNNLVDMLTRLEYNLETTRY